MSKEIKLVLLEFGNLPQAQVSTILISLKNIFLKWLNKGLFYII